MRPEASVLVQVVPPGSGGVRDYAESLQAEWQRCGTSSAVITLSKELALDRSLADRIEDDLGTKSNEVLSPSLAVVLHYSGYGYSNRGLCFWLLHQLQLLRERHRHALRLVVVFHELYASGPPWRSAFWLSPAQAWLAARLADAADALWTNSEHHADWLRHRRRTGMALRIQPVFSNVGEPDHVPAWPLRQPQAVVFGSASTRQRAFDALRPHEGLLQKLGVKAVIEVGPGPESAGLPTILPCQHLGRLDIDALGGLLLTSRIGLIDYPSSMLGKSSVLAAYAAHGCLAINTRKQGANNDGLTEGIDYFALQTIATVDGAASSQFSTEAMANMATRLCKWYGEHRLPAQANALLELCSA